MTVKFLDLKALHEPIQKEVLKAVFQGSGWYVRGNECQNFEEEFATYCGASLLRWYGERLRRIAAILRAYDIGLGDDVLVPEHTFIATWLAVTNLGARAVPVPVRNDTYNIDASLIEPAITDRTKAIIAVHLIWSAGGHGCSSCSRCAVSPKADRGRRTGARGLYRGNKVGTLGDAAAFSFYPGKNLRAIGDAGAVVTNCEETAAKVRRLGNYGSERKYIHDCMGVNSRLDELNCSAAG